MTFKVKDGLQVGSTLVVDANGKLTTGLSTARTIALSGDVTGSVSFDGTGNVTISTTMQSSSTSLDARYYTETEADSRFVNASGDTMSGVLNGIDIRSQGQIRATGWYNANSGSYTGLATEIGVSGGQSYILSYNRDTSAYNVLNLNATYVTTDNSLRAPIFYDSNDTGYYVDPASTSNLNALSIAGTATFASASPLTFTSTSPALFEKNDSGTSVGYYMRKSGSSIADGTTFGVVNLQRWNHTNTATTAGASIFFELKDSAGTSREYAGITGRKTEAGAAGGQLDFHNYGRNVVAWTNASELTHASSVRAPIFYDSNNTSYYVDPSSSGTSGVFAGQLVVGDGIRTATSGFASPYNLFALSDTYDGATFFGIKYVEGSPDTIQIIGANNVGLSIGMDTGNTIASHSLRAPIFYDSNDTSYYVDPRSASVLSGLKLNGVDNNASGSDYILWINKPNNNDWGVSITGQYDYNYMYDGAASHSYGVRGLAAGVEYWRVGTDLLYHNSNIRAPIFYDSSNTSYYWDPGASSAHRLQTPTGYLDLGSMNASWCHFQTDRPGFYFGTKTSHDGGISAYDSNDYSYFPIYYDYNDTGYYLDPNSTGTSYRGRGEILLGPNSSSKYLRLGGNGGATDYSTVSTSNGNLHIDATSGSNLYLAWYNTSDVMVGGGMQATIYYDRNNTGYYCDPASTSNFNQVNAKGKSLLEVGGIGSATTGTWYTIAVNSGNRASARFSLTDYTSGCHQSVDFYATHHYGNYSGINVISQGYYSTTPFRYLRIVEGGTYDGAMLQVYMDTTSSGPNSWMMDNFQSSGWVLLGTWVPHGTNPGTVANFAALTNVAAQVDLDTTGVGGMVMTGNIYAGGNVTAYSDRRLKTNITKIDNALEKLSKINGYTFDRVDRHMERQAGVIAQEVVEVLPEVVGGEGTDDSPYAVSYGNMSALLIEAIKEQQTQIEELKAMVAALLNK